MHALDHPTLYKLFTHFVSRSPDRKPFFDRYVPLKDGDRVLDLGCGLGSALPHIPNSCAYVGVDSNASYIERAGRMYGDRGTFHCRTVESFCCDPGQQFDWVLALGFLHHLDDDAARYTIALGYNALKPGGRLVTLDGLRSADNTWYQRIMLGLDRGKFIRSAPSYRTLLSQQFSIIKEDRPTDLLRIPYPLYVTVCER